MAIYLQIPNIPGDSTSKAFPNLFTLSTAQWGAGTPTQVTSTGIKPGIPSFSQITVQKVAQLQSPNLMLALAQGKNLGTVVITTTAIAAGTSAEVATSVITLSNAVLSSYAQSMESGVSASESLSFAYTRIDFTTYTYAQNGSVAKSFDHFWDLVLNKGA